MARNPGVLTKNPNVIKWVDEMVALTKPDQVIWIDGSKEQLDELTNEVCSLPDGNKDKMYRLNPEKLPGCLYHRTLPNDVARVEDRTFICCREKKDAGPTNNWMDPKEMKAMLTPMYDGVMKGRTMYVIPYSMGPIGSSLAKVGVELTDSIYVVLNMNIMTRMGADAFKNLGDTSNDFVRGLHSKADVDPEKRYIVQFPEENTIWSINSAYGGNVLLGKKCFALRIASYQGKNEGWMAEHMLILGVKKPDGEMRYITAAFPSACGKTNLAMLIPPAVYKEQGYEVYTVGDDIAWMKPGKDGRLYAINPENGFFGVAPGTNAKSNYNALASTMKNTIFTNVALNNADNTVWWEGLDKNPPVDATEWKGAKVNGPEFTSEIDPATGKNKKLAHPNSRFTAPAVNCPCVSPEFNNPDGVPVSAIIFGGRRASTTPLVYQSFDWVHGTYMGSAVSSETTAAATGAVGVLRHDLRSLVAELLAHLEPVCPTATSSGRASATTCVYSTGSSSALRARLTLLRLLSASCLRRATSTSRALRTRLLPKLRTSCSQLTSTSGRRRSLRCADITTMISRQRAATFRRLSSMSSTRSRLDSTRLDCLPKVS